MRQRPDKLSKRPDGAADPLDPLSDLIDTLRLSTEVQGAFELTVPFALCARRHADIHVLLLGVVRGSVTVSTEGARPATLTAGDVLLHTSSRPIELRDSPGTRAALTRALKCPWLSLATLRDDGDEARSAFVGVGFRLATPLKGPLLAQLPPMLVASPAASRTLDAALTLFRAEATAIRSGGRALLRRMAEVLFIELLRQQGEAPDGARGDLRALTDPALARALAAIHGDPAAAWTIESLGRVAGLSRSALAARFVAKVGETPMQYLTRSRMTRAAQLLLESEGGLNEIAARVGYRSEASFHHAFTRFIGETPGAFRRKQRGTRAP